MENTYLLLKTIERIHETAVAILKRQGLDKQTREDVGLIAEEAHKLSQAMSEVLDGSPDSPKREGIVGNVVGFLLSIIPILRRICR